MSTESHLPVDTSVIMPAAVRAAGAAADALLAAGTAPPPAQQAAPPPVGGPPPPPAGFTQQPPMASQPQVPPQVTSGAPQSNGELPPAQPGTPEALWERRARSYHGQMTADRAQFQRDMAGMRAQVESLMDQIAGRAPVQSGAPAGAPISVALDPTKRAKLVEMWGEEMTAAMEDVARDMAGAAAGQITRQVGSQLEGTRADIHARDQAAMETSLDQMLPDWKIVNNDPDFKNWLQQPDGFSRLSKHQVLLDAYNANDTQTVYQIFAAYMLPQGGNGPGTTPPAHIPPQPSQRLPMHQFAAPGPARPAGHGTPVEPDVLQYTPSHIAQFFRDLGRGVYNDTPARKQWAQGIEADIYAAQREGRVVPDQPNQR